MPSSPPLVSKGFQVSFDSNPLNLLMDVNPASVSNDVIDSTTQDVTSNRTKIANGFTDAGDLTLTLQVNPDTFPPVGTKGPLVITWPQGATWTGEGVMSAFDITGAIGEMVVADVTIALSGDFAVVAPT